MLNQEQAKYEMKSTDPWAECNIVYVSLYTLLPQRPVTIQYSSFSISFQFFPFEHCQVHTFFHQTNPPSPLIQLATSVLHSSIVHHTAVSHNMSFVCNLLIPIQITVPLLSPFLFCFLFLNALHTNFSKVVCTFSSIKVAGVGFLKNHRALQLTLVPY